jgi:LemA protein
MEIIGYVLVGLLVVTGVYVATTYNNLMRLERTVTKNWSNIDVLLKQGHDELPNLVETCKAYMTHERETLVAVMGARSAVASARQAGDIAALGPAEGALRTGLGSLFAVAEAYPDLKANETFQHVQTRISQLENPIADLSTKSQDELTAAYRSKAIGGLALFLIAGVALAVTLTARFAG